MKVFIGVLLAVIVGAFVFKLVRDKNAGGESAGKQGTEVGAAQPGSEVMHNTTVEEVLQASSYTYLRVKEGQAEYWIATVKNDVAVGSKYSFGNALEMTNFKSKELDRTFSTIYFVSENADQAASQQNGQMAPTTMGRPKVELKTDAVIQQSAGGISIAELYKNRSSYANKKVKVKGKVAKVNNEVMDRNWVHIQDGTNDSGNFDLTVTTLDQAKIDDIVEFEGTIILNKDFGAGYVYELIMEGGVIRK
ncbi:MAG: GW dipeptide domain-containing protein [Bacteroidia bacterium]|nr:GW dipeptide domain-containing protein [Bacteroidia bacterium]